MNHRVRDVPLVPGTCYLQMVAAAARQLFGGAAYSLESVTFEKILQVDVAEPPVVRLTVYMAVGHGGGRHVTIESQSGEGWTLHAAMVLRVGAGFPEGRLDMGAVTKRCGERVACGEAFYGTLGNAYGGDFRSLVAVWHGAAESIGELELPLPENGQGASGPHSLRICALLDCAIHSGGILPMTAVEFNFILTEDSLYEGFFTKTFFSFRLISVWFFNTFSSLIVKY